MKLELEDILQVAEDNMGIEDCFRIGQTVLVRSGKQWFPRQIKGITLFRNRGGEVEPRFWFGDFGNWSLTDVIAVEDIKD